MARIIHGDEQWQVLRPGVAPMETRPDFVCVRCHRLSHEFTPISANTQDVCVICLNLETLRARARGDHV